MPINHYINLPLVLTPHNMELDLTSKGGERMGLFGSKRRKSAKEQRESRKSAKERRKSRKSAKEQRKSSE